MLSPKLTKIFAPMLVLLSPVAVTAASIELTSPDGLISLQGELLSYDGEIITLQTDAGTVSLRADRVSCLGADCPLGLAQTNDAPPITIAIADPQALALARSVLNTSTASSSRSAVSGGAALPDRTFETQANVAFVPASTNTAGEIIITDVIAPETTTAIGSIQDWITETAPSQLLAMKAMSLIAAPNIEVQSLTVLQIAQIFAGEVVNWAEVGGPDIDMTLLLTDDSSRLHEDVQTVLMRPARKPITPAFVAMQDATQIEKAVRVTPGSISLIPSELAVGANTLGITDHCGVTTWPTDFAIRSGDYPLTLSTLVVYPYALDTPFIHAAFDSAASQTGPAFRSESDQPLVASREADKAKRFVALMGQDLSTTEKQSAADLIELLIDADQLSVSFTGGDLSQTDGAWARAHFVQLRDAIATGAFDGQEIIFVGFANDQDETAAHVKSQAAADQILTAFRTFAPDASNRETVQFRSSGYGTLGHPACSSQGETAHLAPRIEVWSHPAPH